MTTSKTDRDAADHPYHPLASTFPLMEGGEFTALIDDIRAHGLREPIILYDGMILDGRNRDRACREAGIAPQFREMPFGSRAEAAAYVISANILRRHLTGDQKRELIEKLLKANPEQSNRQIAETAKVSDKTVGTVRRKAEARAEIPHVKKRTDRKGRAQPAHKTPRKTRTKTKPSRKAPEPKSAPRPPRLSRHDEQVVFQGAVNALADVAAAAGKRTGDFTMGTTRNTLVQVIDFLWAVAEVPARLVNQDHRANFENEKHQLELKVIAQESEIKELQARVAQTEPTISAEAPLTGENNPVESNGASNFIGGLIRLTGAIKSGSSDDFKNALAKRSDINLIKIIDVLAGVAGLPAFQNMRRRIKTLETEFKALEKVNRELHKRLRRHAA
jgi:hypothetical protein